MKVYLDLLRQVLKFGERREDRTGIGTISFFGAQMRIDISKSFPLLTTKKVHFKSIAYELLWFLHGNTNVKYLQDNGVKIWNEWADINGDLGPIYGAQWRKWKSENREIDQIANVIKSIKSNPFSRRHIVSAWNVGELDKMALPPCHSFFQFYVHKNGGLSCQLYQRSGDLFLGVPFNIASYSLLTYMIAKICNLKPCFFIHVIGDAHIYLNHIEQVKIQLQREPKQLPTLHIDDNVNDIDDFKFESFNIENYDPWPSIKATVAT